MVGVVDQSSTGAFIGVGEGFCSAPYFSSERSKSLSTLLLQLQEFRASHANGGGITANERMAASSRGKDSVAAFGFPLRRLSPGSVPAHWNSWEGVEVLPTLDPVRKTSQYFLKTFHSSTVTPTSIFDRSSFRPWVAASV